MTVRHLSTDSTRNIVIYCKMAAETELYFGVISHQTIVFSGSADFWWFAWSVLSKVLK